MSIGAPPASTASNASRSPLVAAVKSRSFHVPLGGCGLPIVVLSVLDCPASAFDTTKSLTRLSRTLAEEVTPNGKPRPLPARPDPRPAPALLPLSHAMDYLP